MNQDSFLSPFLSSKILLPELKRINLISGKGGVGRTTHSAALARACARAGKKTLLVEMEDESGWDSSLARLFNQKKFTDTPQEVEKNLYAFSCSALTGQEAFLNRFLKITALTHRILSNQGVKWFLEGAPAFKEMGIFNHLLMYLKKDFEKIILDLPATGHLAGLTQLPRILLKLIPVGPIAEQLKEGQRYFYDRDQTASWIVTLPQTLPVSEAIELKIVLEKENIPMGGFILNRAPLNPFTPEEETILSSLPVNLEKIRRLREAEARLSKEMPGRVWQTREVFQPDQLQLDEASVDG